ncbi:uncharacterized protein LOC127705655 isoform X2 [Mytilus californianus]|uniref:uncharacterized protein LOC127705655 isoform X2 n=1 Tax=Mytilus californianus TaxID=6549 RepID=UPI002245A185|nr:uncharacterized protein LOC127705655 isoform X2 [Mytilus californianus]
MHNFDTRSVTLLISSLIVSISTIIILAICVHRRYRIRKSKERDKTDQQWERYRQFTSDLENVDLQKRREQQFLYTWSSNIDEYYMKINGADYYNVPPSSIADGVIQNQSRDEEQMCVDLSMFFQDKPTVWVPLPPPDPPNPQ